MLVEFDAADPEIHGKIEVRSTTQEADFPEPLKPPVGAPNVLLIMGDDVGYGHTSTFGDRRTRRHSTDFPSRGLIYNNFHTTAVCAALRCRRC